MSRLADFRAEGEAPPIEPDVFRQTKNLDMPVLAFDQTTSNTGVAHLVGGKVTKTEMIRPNFDLGNIKPLSKLAMLLRADYIFEEVRLMLARDIPRLVIIERPPEASGKLAGSGESSLAAAVAIRAACRSLRVNITMVQSQHMKKVITGNAKASKAEVGEAVRRIVGEWDGPKNEHTHDAIGLGLVGAEEWSMSLPELPR